MKEILLTKGKVALVDDDDFKWLSKYKWQADKSRNTQYACRYSHRVNGKIIKVKMHRELLDLKRGDKRECDHRDGDGLNNQRSNLRICSNSQNQQNKLPKLQTSSKLKGIHLFKRYNKWTAHIRYQKKAIFLGYFTNEFDAAKAYDKAALKYFGEFARLNFPERRETG